MTKGTELLQFEKSEVTALKRSENLREKFLRLSDAVKQLSASPNKYRTRKSTGMPENVSPQLKKRIIREVKKNSSSATKILKSRVDDPCCTRTITRHLKKEKIKHKKRIRRPRLTMKHKDKGLEYARQYQTMSAKEWRKIVFSNEKKFNLDGPYSF